MDLRSFFVRLGLDVDSASFAAGDAMVEGLKAGLELVVDAAKEASHFITEQVKSTVEAGVAADHMSKVLGMTADQYQRLSYAAKVSEVSQEALSGALRKMAMKGSPDPIERLAQYADHIAGLTNPSQRTTYALNNLGRGGRELIPMLEKGGAAFRQMMKDADDLGAVMSGSDIAAAKELKEEQVKLGLAGEGLRNRIIVPLLGTLSKFAVALTKIVVQFQKWYIESHDKLVGVLKVLAIGIGVLTAAFLINSAAAFLDATGVAWLTTVTLAAGRAAVVAAWEFISAWAAAAAPVLLIAGILGAVYLVLNDFVGFLNGDESVIGDAIKKWIGPFTDWRDGIHKVFEAIKKDVADLVQSMKDAFKLSNLAMSSSKHSETTESLEGETGLQKWARAKAPWLFGGAGSVGNTIGGGAASPQAAAANFTPAGGDLNYSPGTGGPAAVVEHHHYHHHETTLKVEVGDHGVKRLLDGHEAAQNRETAAATGT